MSESPVAQLLGDKLHAIGARLQSPEGRAALVGGCVLLLRRTLRWTTIVYLLGLFGLCLLMRWVGERNVFFAFCLYLPPLLWYLPAFVLLPGCLVIWEWRGLLLGIVAIGVSLVMFFQFKVPGGGPGSASSNPPDGDPRLVVLTNNRGQHGNASMKPFKNMILPDVMAFQEGAGLAARYLADAGYGEFKHGQSVGEFSLVSKHPILSSELITLTVRSAALPSAADGAPSAAGNSESVQVAARFVIDMKGRHVVIYNVHLPTPRDTLLSYRRGTFLYGLIGIPGTSLGERREANQRGWDQRIELVEQLLEKAGKEVGPTLLVGDFNMPGSGYCHRRVTAGFQDAHAEAGEGFGFTFPGTSHNPLSLGQPWLRIDYVFADKAHWRVNASKAEANRASQHRATAAELQLCAQTGGK